MDDMNPVYVLNHTIPGQIMNHMNVVYVLQHAIHSISWTTSVQIVPYNVPHGSYLN